MRELQHNIVNVLYTVKGIIESHLALVQEGRFEKKEKELDDAHKALEKAYERVNKALDITRRLGFLLKEEEKNLASPPKVSLPAAWQKALRILRKECPLNGLEILERIPGDFPLLQCRAGELQEILYNLCENAAHAIGGRGKLILRACLAFSTKEEPLAVLTVADTGPGIPEKVLRRVFQPFFTTKPEGGGNGLGLYLVKRLVERNHGRINVSSYEGLGTTFTLEFPVA